MPVAFHRCIALLTAAIVALVSLNCSCATAARSLQTKSADASNHKCCDASSPAPRPSHDKPAHDPTCHHCNTSVTAAASANTTTPAAPLAVSSFVIPPLFSCAIAPSLELHITIDSHPSPAPPLTLLDLRCALTT